MEGDHTSHYAQAPNEPRRAKRHICQNYPDDVFQVHNRNKHHPCNIPSEYLSPYGVYIVVAMSDNLSDQITHAKFFSSYHYEQQKLKEKGRPKVVKFVHPGNIINSSCSKDILRIFKILDYNLVRCKRHSFTFTLMSDLID